MNCPKCDRPNSPYNVRCWNCDAMMMLETDLKVKRICGNWNNAGDRVQDFVLADVARKLERERNEARAMARDQRNQLEKASPARLIFPWENS